MTVYTFYSTFNETSDRNFDPSHTRHIELFTHTPVIFWWGTNTVASRPCLPIQATTVWLNTWPWFIKTRILVLIYMHGFKLVLGCIHTWLIWRSCLKRSSISPKILFCLGEHRNHTQMQDRRGGPRSARKGGLPVRFRMQVVHLWRESKSQDCRTDVWF